MKRYMLRKYGRYHDFDIPFVTNAVDIGIKELFSERNRVFSIAGDILTINRINRHNTREFVKTVLDIRKKYWEKIIYLPATGMIYDYPILFYLGIDILDDLPIRILGNNKCITEFGLVNDGNCLQINMKEKERMVERIKMSLENSKFRELVEAYSITPFSKEALRIMDMQFYEYMGPFMDLREKDIRAVNIESIYRPEIEYFRRKVVTMRQTSRNLLLIPCSAVKPYSMSKTHRILHSRISPYLNGLQELIVTSPLGLVPRELENFFPARNYDIPVTGYWFDEEKKMLKKLAEEYFREKKYDNVFYVLSDEEAWITELFENAEGIKGNLNFENSDKISSIIAKHSIRGNKSTKRKIEFSNIVKYTYGLDIDPESINIKDEGNRVFLMKDNEKFAKITESGISMELGIAKTLSLNGKRTFEINGKFQGKNIYMPGIKKMTDDIVPGNEVVLVSNDLIIGRGISEISSLDMRTMEKGVGISDVSYF